MKYPQSLQDLIESFMLYPGIGPKTAERLAFHTLLKLDKDQVKKFSECLIKAHQVIKKCEICGNLTEDSICDICKDTDREKQLMIVETSKEVISFEKTNQFRGKYHVLNGLISPLNGVGPENLNLKGLIDRVEKEQIQKVIVATSATIAGEMTAMYIKNVLNGKEVEVYRIGYGLPAGGDIEYADEITLLKALEGMKKI